MAKLDRCTACNGRKRVVGMGGMERKCDVCHGVGWVEQTLNASDDKQEKQASKKTVKRKKKAA